MTNSKEIPLHRQMKYMYLDLRSTETYFKCKSGNSTVLDDEHVNNLEKIISEKAYLEGSID